MSDPVTNAEIEDVLSSIRRLVSTDEREEPAAPKAVPDEQDKLVLTPSQRVDDAPENDDPENVSATEHAPEKAVSLAQYAVEPDPESDAPQHDAEAEERAAADDVPETSGEPDAAPQPEFKHHEADHFFKASEHGAENGNKFEADGGPEGSDSLAADVVADASEKAEQDAPNGGDQAAVDAEEAAEANAPEDDSPDLQARIASVEAALAGRDDEWEPDGDDDDPYAGEQMTTLEWEDHASDERKTGEAEKDTEATVFEAAADKGFEPEAEGLGDDFTPSAVEQDDHLERAEETASSGAGDDWHLESDVLDEEALRDMVSEIVRQELQGALGERITRNVRKLVRRELHRALASQEFE